MSLGGDAMMAQIEQQIAEAQERAKRSQEFRQSTQSARGKAEEGGIRVEVDSSGLVKTLELPERLNYWSGSSLGPKILELIGHAQADVSKQIKDQAAETFGPDSEITDRVAEELADHFGQ